MVGQWLVTDTPFMNRAGPERVERMRQRRFAMKSARRLRVTIPLSFPAGGDHGRGGSTVWSAQDRTEDVARDVRFIRLII